MTLIDKAEALDPCPFCGWAEVFTSIYGRHAKKWGILCNGCDAWLAGYDSETAARAAWNRRAALPARGVGVKALDDLERFSAREIAEFAEKYEAEDAERWLDYQHVYAALAPTDAAHESIRCAECDCANGGDECTWIKTTTDAAQAREAHLREAASAVRARYMGDNNREDQEVLRCEAAILALIDKPASAAQAREAALHDRITEALVAAQERAHRAYEQDAPFDPNEHKVRISVKDTYAILALIGEPRP